MKSCNDINQELNLGVSKWTVWRALKEDPNITRAVMRPAPRLTNVHKAIARCDEVVEVANGAWLPAAHDSTTGRRW
uniref:Transposable element Tc3 transposase-like DNA-binding HTH domain-containing protein n=1 Tax=Caenorhabditis japonica TaxID=281687 RepID=A0A8R1IBT2_CAEJA